MPTEDPYIDWRVRSQSLFMEGDEVWVLYPVIAQSRVTAIAVVRLYDGRQRLELARLSPEAEGYAGIMQKMEEGFAAITAKMGKKANRTAGMQVNRSCNTDFYYCPIESIDIIVTQPKPRGSYLLTYDFYDDGGPGGAGGCGDFNDCGPPLGPIGGGQSPKAPRAPKVNPCDRVKASIGALNALMSNPDIKAKFSDKLKAVPQGSHENFMKVGVKGDGSYTYSDIGVGQQFSGQLNDVSLSEGTYFMDGHTHPDFAVPSAGDLYGLMERATSNYPDLKYRFVFGHYFGEKDTYVLVVNDKAAIESFLQQYPKSDNYDENTHGIKKYSPLYYAFDNISSNAQSGNYSGNGTLNLTKDAIVLSALLSNTNAGVAVARLGNDNKFGSINVKSVNGGGLVIDKCP